MKWQDDVDNKVSRLFIYGLRVTCYRKHYVSHETNKKYFAVATGIGINVNYPLTIDGISMDEVKALIELKLMLHLQTLQDQCEQALNELINKYK